MKLKTYLFYLLLIPAVFSCTTKTVKEETASKPMQYEKHIVDKEIGGRTAIGDIDGDGINDLVVHTWGSKRGQVEDGSVSWYKSPEGTKTLIADKEGIFGDGVVVHDVDNDGLNDVVICKGNDWTPEIYWCKNNGKPEEPMWEQHLVAVIDDKSEVKDVEVHDMDNDGKVDIVVRTKHTFNIFFQDGPDDWVLKDRSSWEREGMTLGDLDGDHDYDVVMNGFFYENPDDPRNEPWPMQIIDNLWFSDSTGGWQDFSVMTAVNDFDGDGAKDDVVFGHPEKTGFMVTWYSSDNPKGGASSWIKHEVGIVDYCHTVYAEDMDLDGDVDILTGVLKRSDTPGIYLFLNNGSGESWERFLVDSVSTYKAKAGDIDGDGDMDITGALSWEDAPIYIWENKLK